MIFLGLLGSLVYTLFLPQTWLFFTAGLYVLTMNTVPVGATVWMIGGLVRWIVLMRNKRQLAKMKAAAAAAPAPATANST